MRQHDSSKHDGQIEILLNHYHDRFRPNDFRNLADKQVDDAIVCYLVGHTRKLRKHNMTLVMKLTAEERNLEREQITAQAFRDLFKYRSQLAKRQAIYQVPRIALLVAIGLAILFTSHLVKEIHLDETIAGAISDAIAVGGWVAMWTAFAGVFTAIFDSYRKARLLRKLADSPIHFQYGTAALQQSRELSPEEAADEVTTLLPQ